MHGATKQTLAVVSEDQDVVDLSLPATGSLVLSGGATRTLRYVQEGWDTGRSRRASRCGRGDGVDASGALPIATPFGQAGPSCIGTSVGAA